MKEMALKLRLGEEWELVSTGKDEKEKNIFWSKGIVSYKKSHNFTSTLYVHSLL